MSDIHNVASACMRLCATLRSMGLQPENTDVIASITVRESAFVSLLSDAMLREMNPRDGHYHEQEMFIQVNDGYRVRVVCESDE